METMPHIRHRVASLSRPRRNFYYVIYPGLAPVFDLPDINFIRIWLSDAMKIVPLFHKSRTDYLMFLTLLKVTDFLERYNEADFFSWRQLIRRCEKILSVRILKYFILIVMLYQNRILQKYLN